MNDMLGTSKSTFLRIEKGEHPDLEELFPIYVSAKMELERKGIFQWTNNYPTRDIIENDLRQGVLHLLKEGSEIIGAINLSEEQEKEYQSIQWKFTRGKILVIHRLVICPQHQRQGYASKLMDFAEDFAREKDYSSIRLDAYSDNQGVLGFYKKREYFIRGEVYFPEREHPFFCMEKEVDTYEGDDQF